MKRSRSRSRKTGRANNIMKQALTRQQLDRGRAREREGERACGVCARVAQMIKACLLGRPWLIKLARTARTALCERVEKIQNNINLFNMQRHNLQLRAKGLHF